MMHWILTILVAAAWLPLIQAANSTHYTAAVVEYFPYVGNVTANAINYMKFIEDASNKGADIIVFPEAGLNGRGPAQDKTVTAVPDPALNITICDLEDPKYNAALRQLSCTARSHRIYVVVNLIEYSDEVPNGTLKYNTNAVLNRDGAIISRYRKANLYIEPGITPFKSIPTYFDTDFGVRFGMFICFDIMFEKPALQLTRELGIKHIIYNTAWYAELPFYASIQGFQAWAYDQDVTMLVSGYNVPQNGSGGSGIFLGRAGTVYTRLSDTPASEMYIASLPISRNATTQAAREVTIITQDTPPSSQSKQGDKIKMRKQNLLAFESALIEKEVASLKLCDGGFCCDFASIYDSRVGPQSYSYRAIILDGVRELDGLSTKGIQTCAIVSCHNHSLSSCGARIDSRHTFTFLSISGNFTNVRSHITANTLSENYNGLTPLDANQIKFAKVCKNETCVVTLQSTTDLNGLLTFAINSRVFSKDEGKPSPPRSGTRNTAALFYQTALMCWTILLILSYENTR